MKFIKIFIASSIVAFEQEREDLKSYISSLNDTYVKRGIYFEMILCEHLSNAIGKDRKQEEYNAEIRDSQYFYVLLADEIGQYTLEEFNVALKQFQKSGTPRIYAYFRELPEGQPPSDSVQHFLTRLDSELNHYYSRFVHIDSIKLNMLLELTRDPDLNANIQVQDGQVSLNGTPVLSTKNIPIYHRNEELQKRISEKAELDERFAELRIAQIDDPSNDDIFDQLLTISHQRNQLATQIHQMENDILTLCSTICGFSSSGQPLTWREKKAHELLDIGNYDGALSVLNDELRQKELAQAEAVIEKGDAIAKNGIYRIKCYISENTLKIQTLKSTGINISTVQSIIACYEECVSLISCYHICYNVLLEYAIFLYDQCYYDKAIILAMQIYNHYKMLSPLSENLATSKILLGMLYFKHNEYDISKKFYTESIDIYLELIKENPNNFGIQLANAYDNLANLFTKTNDLDKAESLYRNALEILDRLASSNPVTLESTVATISCNLACLLRQTDQLEEAETLFRKSLTINWKHFKIKSIFDRSASELARTSYNLSLLFRDTNQLENAKMLQNAALDCYQILIQENPNAFAPDAAYVYYNLAKIFHNNNRVAQAESLYQKSLEIYRHLSQKSDIYKMYLSRVCNNLGNIFRDTSRIRKANSLFQEASHICPRFSPSKNDIVFKFQANLECSRRLNLLSDPFVADNCYNLANLLVYYNKIEEAKSLYQEAEKIYRQCLEECVDDRSLSESYRKSLYNIYCNLATISKNANNLLDAKLFFNKLLSIFQEDLYNYCNTPNFNNVVNFLRDTTYIKEDNPLWNDFLSIYQKLPKEFPRAMDIELARVCNIRESFLRNAKQVKEANIISEKLKNAELFFWRTLKFTNNFSSYYAEYCNSMGSFLLDTKRTKDAELLFRESLLIYRRLAQKNPSDFHPNIVTVRNNLANLLRNTNRTKEAESLYRENRLFLNV